MKIAFELDEKDLKKYAMLVSLMSDGSELSDTINKAIEEYKDKTVEIPYEDLKGTTSEDEAQQFKMGLAMVAIANITSKKLK